MTLEHWDARIARARHLAVEHPDAAELLTFYARVAEAQRSLAERVEAPPDIAGLRDRFDELAATVPDFLRELEGAAPMQLSPVLRGLLYTSADEWCLLFSSYLSADRHEPDDVDEVELFVVEAMLQPLAEAVVHRNGDLSAPLGGALCPTCAGKPVVAVLREEAQSAARSLICGLCFTEWRWPRIKCPACGETEFDKLVAYTTPAFPARQIDGCDTCRRYLHTIDLSKNALALPVVDELAGLALDLWARGEGYRKLRPNLLRM